MKKCSSGHDTVSHDFCDVCGVELTTNPNLGMNPDRTPRSNGGSSKSSAPAGKGCPICGEPRVAAFCELCGFDFSNNRAPVEANDILSSSEPQISIAAPSPAPAPFSAASNAAPTINVPPAITVTTATVTATPAPITAAAPAAFTPTRAVHQNAPVDNPALATPAPASAPSVTPATADAAVPAPAEAVPAPVAPPAIAWSLALTPTAANPTGQPRLIPFFVTEMIVGRSSKKRGTTPDIDLQPDDAVSHRHALIKKTVEGNLEITDLASANGTHVNNTELKPNEPRVLLAGDQIHLGEKWSLIVKSQS